MVSVVMPGKLHLNDVASLFGGADVLLHLKEEFGGLQTVFRNHRQVFKGLSAIECSVVFFPVVWYVCRCIALKNGESTVELVGWVLQLCWK